MTIMYYMYVYMVVQQFYIFHPCQLDDDVFTMEIPYMHIPIHVLAISSIASQHGCVQLQRCSYHKPQRLTVHDCCKL